MGDVKPDSNLLSLKFAQQGEPAITIKVKASTKFGSSGAFAATAIASSGTSQAMCSNFNPGRGYPGEKCAPC